MNKLLFLICFISCSIICLELVIVAARKAKDNYELAKAMIGSRAGERRFEQMCDIGNRECLQDGETRVLFWHIPKSGGSTMKNLFRRIFRLQYVLCSTTEDSKRWKQRRKDVENLHPHFAVGASLQTLLKMGDGKSQVVLMAMFKEPVSLRKSLYLYRKNPTEHEVDKKTTANLTVADFLTPQQSHLSMTNFLCASLSGTPQELGHFLDIKHLDIAKQRVQKMFVLLLSDFEHSMRMLSNMLGWKVSEKEMQNAFKSKVNAGVLRNTTLSSEELELIRKVNWCDVELYEFIKRQYERVKNFHAHYY